MLSCVERAVDLIARTRGERVDLSRIPYDDGATYKAIQKADTMGVFQIESRAQMQSLYRTRPESLDDLTIQVAIVRPGPILGGAVNPYIARSQRLREDPGFVVPYDHPSLEPVLRDTLGTIIFQDQVIEVAMAFAGFSPGEAEGLRRAMSRKRSEAAIEAYHQRFIEGAARTHGADAETAERVYAMIVGFSGFGFPKAHGAAFGLLAYQSTWLRVHYGPEFLCALLNEQPMGFYAPDTLVHEAQRKGIQMIAPDVNLSAEECTVDAGRPHPAGAQLRARRPQRGGRRAGRRARRGRPVPLAVRPGLARGGGAGDPRPPRLGGRLRRARGRRRRGGAGAAGRRGALATARRPSARRRAVAARRTALWRLGVAAPGAAVKEGTQLALPLELPGRAGARSAGGVGRDGGRLRDDRAHPGPASRRAAAARPAVRRGLDRATSRRCAHDTPVTLGGLVVARQRPGTAKGIVFLLLEDEFGTVNLIVPPDVYERHRLAVRTEPLLLARGKLEKLPIAGGAINVYVRSLRPLYAPRGSAGPTSSPLADRGRAARAGAARASEVRRPRARWPTSAASPRRCRASRRGGAADAAPRRDARPAAPRRRANG